MVSGWNDSFKLCLQVFDHLHHYLAVNSVNDFDLCVLNGAWLSEVLNAVAVQSYFFLTRAEVFFGSCGSSLGELIWVKVSIRPLKDFEVDYVLQFYEVDHQLICLAHPVVWRIDGRLLGFFELLNFYMAGLLALCDADLLGVLLDFGITLKIGFKFGNLPCDLLYVSLWII